MAKNVSFAIGIDFGTTTSRIHYFRDTDTIFPEEVPAVRSIVAALPATPPRQKHDWYTGLQAYNKPGCFARFKLQMGRMTELRPGADFSRPEVLAARLMWVLRRRLQEHVARQEHDSSESVDALERSTSVTVTVPAGWTTVERSATIFAAKMAGFSNVNIIEEPVAAFLAIATHFRGRIGNAENVLVFDCGGGTLDLALVRRDFTHKKQLPIVVGRAMDTSCVVGERIDEIIAQKWAGDMWEDLLPDERYQLMEAAREVKEALNPERPEVKPQPRAWATHPILIHGKEFSVDELSLTYDELVVIVEPLVEVATERIKSLLLSNGLNEAQVARVIMVGGSSYLRHVKERIEALFPALPSKVVLVKPEAVVAVGAADYQSSLNRKELIFVPTLSLDTYLEYQKKVDGSVSYVPFALGDAGDSLQEDLKSSWAPETVTIPTDISFPATWRVYQKQRIPGSEPREIASVTIPVCPSFRNARLQVRYRINRNGELALWAPRLLGKTDNKDLEVAYKSPYDWDKAEPVNLAMQHGISDPEP